MIRRHFFSNSTPQKYKALQGLVFAVELNFEIWDFSDLLLDLATRKQFISYIYSRSKKRESSLLHDQARLTSVLSSLSANSCVPLVICYNLSESLLGRLSSIDMYERTLFCAENLIRLGFATEALDPSLVSCVEFVCLTPLLVHNRDSSLSSLVSPPSLAKSDLELSKLHEVAELVCKRSSRYPLLHIIDLEACFNKLVHNVCDVIHNEHVNPSLSCLPPFANPFQSSSSHDAQAILNSFSPQLWIDGFNQSVRECMRSLLLCVCGNSSSSDKCSISWPPSLARSVKESATQYPDLFLQPSHLLSPPSQTLSYPLLPPVRLGIEDMRETIVSVCQRLELPSLPPSSSCSSPPSASSLPLSVYLEMDVSRMIDYLCDYVHTIDARRGGGGDGLLHELVSRWKTCCGSASSSSTVHHHHHHHHHSNGLDMMFQVSRLVRMWDMCMQHLLEWHVKSCIVLYQQQQQRQSKVMLNKKKLLLYSFEPFLHSYHSSSLHLEESNPHPLLVIEDSATPGSSSSRKRKQASIMRDALVDLREEESAAAKKRFHHM